MSDKDFSGPARVVRDGRRGTVERPIIVPQRHNNIHKVFSSTQVHDVVAAPPKPVTSAGPVKQIVKTAPITKSAQPVQHRVGSPIQQKKSPVIHLEDIIGSAPRRAVVEQRKPETKREQQHSLTPTVIQQQLQQMTPATKPTVSAPAKPIMSSTLKQEIDKDFSQLSEKTPKRGTKTFRKAQAKAERAKKAAAERMEQAVKSAALSPEPVASQQRVLAPAASAASVATTAVAPIPNSSGTATMPSGNFVTRVAGAPRITLTFKVDAAKFFAVLRALIIAIILAVSGYLAWDTWMTNKSVESTFSSPAAAMSVDSTNPATADPTSISNEAWAAYTTPADHPRYIYIPSIGVKARVMSVGVTSKGNIDTPKNLNDTAWYDGSAKPDMPGQMFINGHTSFSNTIPAAFNDLPRLEKDAQIIVETGNGNRISYRVVSSETVASDKVDMNKALSTPEDTEKGLTLMTCTGKFDYRAQESSQRFIVYAMQE
ncbi:sortase [Candidatus Saccharibacteria bacterium]|nr:sortase [Candidatus Saccharibacteria bacterium]